VVVRVMILKRIRWAGQVPWIMGKKYKIHLEGTT
jgi:hypothetical protein